MRRLPLRAGGVRGVAWAVLASAVFLTLLLFLSPGEAPAPRLSVDAGTAALFRESNAVVVRYVFPCSDPPAVTAAGSAAIWALVGLGKVPIIQSIDTEAGVCYTNEGRVDRVVERSVEECLDLPYPAIVLIEDREESITARGGVVEVRGPPEKMMALALRALSEVFPEADLPTPERRRR